MGMERSRWWRAMLCSAQGRGGICAHSAHHTGRPDLLQHTLHHHPGVMPRGSPGMGRRGRWQFHRAVWALLWPLHVLFPLLGTPPPSMKLGFLFPAGVPAPPLPTLRAFLDHYLKALGFPWWLSDKEATWQWRRYGFEPWSRKISHAMEQISPYTTAESVL